MFSTCKVQFSIFFTVLYKRQGWLSCRSLQQASLSGGLHITGWRLKQVSGYLTFSCSLVNLFVVKNLMSKTKHTTGFNGQGPISYSYLEDKIVYQKTFYTKYIQFGWQSVLYCLAKFSASQLYEIGPRFNHNQPGLSFTNLLSKFCGLPAKLSY